MTDDQRLDDVVDRRDDEQAPQQHEEAPAGIADVDEPQPRGDPDERRSDRNR